MTRIEYLNWIREHSRTIAANKYPNDIHLQLLFQLGLVQRALADLCYEDSDNSRKVNRMFKRNENR